MALRVRIFCYSSNRVILSRAEPLDKKRINLMNTKREEMRERREKINQFDWSVFYPTVPSRISYPRKKTVDSKSSLYCLGT
jgi:hypothetical protein